MSLHIQGVMMLSNRLTLITAAGDNDVPASLAPAVQRWAEQLGMELDYVSFASVSKDESLLKQTQAAWLFGEGVKAGLVDFVAAIVAEEHLPALISDGVRQRPPGQSVAPGVVAAPLDAPQSVLEALLRAIVGVSEKIAEMRSEIGFLHVHHGGLCDQIGKIDEELRLASQLQKEFLPTELPKVPGLDFEVLFRPASYVSGDIYDVIRLDEAHVGLFLADAVGHGVPAALMTMYIKRAMHTKRVDPSLPNGYEILSPGDSLGQLNRDMCKNAPCGVKTATCVYGVLNIHTHELTYCRAGHPYPMLLRPGGETISLEAEGAMLGIFDEEEFEIGRVQLEPGDRLLFYSDGFELAFPDITKDGKKSINSNRYIDEFNALGQGKVKDAFAGFARRLDDQAGSLNQRDDLTIVCAGINAPAMAGVIQPQAKAG